MKQNAMTDDAKLQRRSDFIATARQLFIAQQCLPTVADIAQHTGLAKGTVYRYFQSKEEIFIALLQADFAALFTPLTEVIQQLPNNAGQASQQFAQHYVKQLVQIPTLLPLAAMLNAVLEHKLPISVLYGFKQFLASALDALGQLLASRFTAVSAAQARSLLLHNYALTLGLYQTLHYPPAVQALLQQQVELQSLQRDFSAELVSAIEHQWLGVLR